MKIKELPSTERPYEKLEMYGEKALSNAELLAIIIKSGTKEETSVMVAQKILRLNNDVQAENLNFLRDLSIEDLRQIKGIGKIKAIQIKAVCELATRMSKPANYRKIQIKSPKDIAKLLMPDFEYLKREVAKVVTLNSKNYIEKIIDVSLGGVNFASISIREILNEVVKTQVPKFILLHNHPSGDSSPSKKDLEFTVKLYDASSIMGIELVDHIVIGKKNYTSIFEQKAQKMKG